jgi:hypothetical protein
MNRTLNRIQNQHVSMCINRMQQMSFWANGFLGKCLLGKCLSGQMSFWANGFWANVHLGKCLFGQMSSWQMSSGQMLFLANVFLGKCLLGKCLLGKCSSEQMSLGKCLWANVSGQMSLGKCRMGKCRITSHVTRSPIAVPFPKLKFCRVPILCLGLIPNCYWQIRSCFKATK